MGNLNKLIDEFSKAIFHFIAKSSGGTHYWKKLDLKEVKNVEEKRNVLEQFVQNMQPPRCCWCCTFCRDVRETMGYWCSLEKRIINMEELPTRPGWCPYKN